MNKKLLQEFKCNFHSRSTSLFIILLLLTDLTFFTLHTITILSTSFNPLFLLYRETSYPAIYQCIKWSWIVVLMAYLIIKIRSLNYGVWVMFFLYLLLDDALQIHENFWILLPSNDTMRLPFGLGIQDIGELVISGIVGIILLSFVVVAYKYGSLAFKKTSRDMVLLVLALVFFGVIVDTIHSGMHPGYKTDMVLGLIEDGGEMIVASIICWYTFLLCVREENNTSNLFDYIRLILTRHST